MSPKGFRWPKTSLDSSKERSSSALTGFPRKSERLLKASGLKIIDATCPRVARVQALIRYHTHKGYLAVIVGEPDHPEVIGLKGHGNGKAFVISTSEEVSLLPEADKVLVVAQTTQEKQTYDRIVETLKKRYPGALVFNTICDATENRQEEVRALATHVDGIVVVGGFHSGNTRRLAQVASSTGLPVFHVETDKQLDRGKLSAMETIGVTAGASTPNWMINKVVQKIESIRSRKETALNRFLRYFTKFIFQTNIVAAFGAFSLAHAMNVLSGRAPDLILPSLAFLYIYAMHVLNRLLDKGAGTYNDPERAAFYRRYRRLLVLSGVVAIAGALILSAFMSLWAFLATAGLSILGTVYSLPIVPLSRRHLWRYSKIKDIPGSKTSAQAFAWGVVIALLPLLGTPGGPWSGEVVSFLFVFSVVYVRSAFLRYFAGSGRSDCRLGNSPDNFGRKKNPVASEIGDAVGFGRARRGSSFRMGRALCLPPPSLLSVLGPVHYRLRKGESSFRELALRPLSRPTFFWPASWPSCGNGCSKRHYPDLQPRRTRPQGPLLPFFTRPFQIMRSSLWTMGLEMPRPMPSLHSFPASGASPTPGTLGFPLQETPVSGSPAHLLSLFSTLMITGCLKNSRSRFPSYQHILTLLPARQRNAGSEDGVRVNPRKKHLKPSGDIFDPSLRLCVVSPSSVLLKRSLLEEVGLFDEAFPVCEDYDLWLRISCKYPIWLIPEFLVIKEGGHPDQLSRSVEGMDRYRIRAIVKLIDSGCLTKRQTEAALKELRFKCRVYGNGCLRRGRKNEGGYYLGLPASLEEKAFLRHK